MRFKIQNYVDCCVTFLFNHTLIMRVFLGNSQNKCVCFCLKLNSRHPIGAKEFKEINWLPTKEGV